MKSVKVYDVKYEKLKPLNVKNLDDLIKKHSSNKNPSSLLPKRGDKVSFKLRGYTSLANALRRVLLEDIPVKCLDVIYDDISTNDEFILTDKLIKNINLIPIQQDVDEKTKVSLSIENNTDDIIDVRASDLKCNKTLIPNDNILLCRLRPKKHLKLSNIGISVGFAKDDASKYSLLNNISYDILDMKSYDQFTGQGQRSIETNPQEFMISFETCCNTTPRQVIDKMINSLMNKLFKTEQYLAKYENTDETYYTEGFSVDIENDLYIYNIHNEYYTLSKLLAHQCYLLDNNVPFCVGTIDRYDNNIAKIKIKHPDSKKLLLASVKRCQEELQLIKKQLLK